MASLRSRIVAALLPWAGIKRAFQSAAHLKHAIACSRLRGPARPPLLARRGIRVQEDVIGGVDSFTAQSKTSEPSHQAIYLHGGAYVLNLMPLHWHLVRRLALGADCRISIPLYDLAPELTCQQIIQRMVHHYEDYLRLTGKAPEAVIGDSAGGGLALALVQQFRDLGLPLPAQVVLLSPWLDATCTAPLQTVLASKDVVLDLPGLRAAAKLYAGELLTSDPLVSPLFGSLKGLPPMHVFVSTNELLLPDSQQLHLKARATNVPLKYYEFKGLFHVWPAAPIPEADEVVRTIRDSLSQESCQPNRNKVITLPSVI